ncbi:manganese-dependent ADP-ribose/CDP-alcohol diphosphatase-like [Selaginella moellendorffii]|uniref:manganese-dependent ADP-ribose/CDP-alcohol diphosphatase-like n=1 Tax=Selaginella moellendorffii TaxID=88036 RepID=UPI000D1C464F|nr:manganese-dependent ADP-ribose/CDP-alcohol diphosphatase-like [Selaginella moellendorffii]|eukprot:XP_024519797.1 manganese-dependent ADP-ribose/CDP-alcohol diphosphatase-like [Selaginella moellendorffii]
MEDRSEEPLASFGLIADVQYGDKADIVASNGKTRRYREAAGKLAKAIAFFNLKKDELLFMLSLGDIVDGNTTKEKTMEDFDVVLAELQKLDLEAVHLIGNHCLSLPRELLKQKLSIPAFYYQRDLCPGWRLVVLDTMDMSVKWPEHTPNYKEALDFQKSHPFGVDHPQMALWNGGIGSKQRVWLDNAVRDAQRSNTKLIVCGHHPIVAGSSPPKHLAWNHHQILSTLLGSPEVVLYLCGHYHSGGYACINGKHFVTLEAILEAPEGWCAHGLLRIYNGWIEIQGYGSVISRRLHFKNI